MTIRDIRTDNATSTARFTRNEAFAWLDRQLELVTADSPQRIEQVFRLRHQVYCIEHTYEQASASGDGQQGDGQESDAWDCRARHLLLRHRDSGVALATARLILADKQDLCSAFPAEDHAGINASRFSDSMLFLPRSSTAEVSRFAISRAARQALRDSGAIPASISERDLSHWITLRLIHGLVTLSREHRVLHWYTMMEGGFIRLLRGLGMHFEPVSGAIEFHGRRFVALDSVDQLMGGMKRQRPGLFRLMTGGGRQEALVGG